jgi:hypothetical protein
MKKDIDDLVKEGLGDYKPNANPDDFWSEISNKLDIQEQEDNKFLYWKLGGAGIALLLILAFSAIFNYQSQGWTPEMVASLEASNRYNIETSSNNQAVTNSNLDNKAVSTIIESKKENVSRKKGLINTAGIQTLKNVLKSKSSIAYLSKVYPKSVKGNSPTYYSGRNKLANGGNSSNPGNDNQSYQNNENQLSSTNLEKNIPKELAYASLNPIELEIDKEISLIDSNLNGDNKSDRDALTTVQNKDIPRFHLNRSMMPLLIGIWDNAAYAGKEGIVNSNVRSFMSTERNYNFKPSTDYIVAGDGSFNKNKIGVGAFIDYKMQPYVSLQVYGAVASLKVVDKRYQKLSIGVGVNYMVKDNFHSDNPFIVGNGLSKSMVLYNIPTKKIASYNLISYNTGLWYQVYRLNLGLSIQNIKSPGYSSEDIQYQKISGFASYYQPIDNNWTILVSNKLSYSNTEFRNDANLFTSYKFFSLGVGYNQLDISSKTGLFTLHAKLDIKNRFSIFSSYGKAFTGTTVIFDKRQLNLGLHYVIR